MAPIAVDEAVGGGMRKVLRLEGADDGDATDVHGGKATEVVGESVA